MPSARRRRTRSVGRSDPPRVRLPGERRRAPAPRVARAASRREPLSSAAEFQTDRRHHAAAVCGGVPAAAGQARAARPQVGDRCHPGRRFRIEQPPVRAGRSEAGDDAVDVSPRRRGRAIRFTTVESPMGRLLVAATPRGVCRVSMGRSDRQLREALELNIQTPASRAMPAGSHAGRGNSRPPCRSRAADGSPARHPGDGVPVAGLGGACRHPVRFDANVRRGGGGDRAAKGGPGRGARLRGQSGRACHSVSRVVPSAGGVGGYRWGASRKEALLAAERRRLAPRSVAGAKAGANVD